MNSYLLPFVSQPFISPFTQSGGSEHEFSSTRRADSGIPPSSVTACNPAYASAMNEVAISVSMTACNAMISPSSFRTSKPVADLYDCRSNAVSKWIATLLLLHTYWVFPVELRVN